jgi:hypothetical protein
MIREISGAEAGEQLSEPDGEAVREKETREFMHQLKTAFPQVIDTADGQGKCAAVVLDAADAANWRMIGEKAREAGRGSPVRASQICKLTAEGAAFLECFCEGYLAESERIRGQNKKILPEKRKR